MLLNFPLIIFSLEHYSFRVSDWVHLRLEAAIVGFFNASQLTGFSIFRPFMLKSRTL